MNIAEAMARSDGIDFYINKKNITISATRNKDGTIIVKRKDKIVPIEKNKTRLRLFSLCMAILGSFIYKIMEPINDWRINVLAVLAFFWFTILLNHCIRTLNPKNKQLFKYHAAEHKVLNYWDKYQETTQDCNKIMEMSSISLRCGTTIATVFLVLITISTLGIVFIPWIISKIIWCLFSIVVTVYLWINGKCNFLQKMVIREPGVEEIEVAVKGMCEYIKVKYR